MKPETHPFLLQAVGFGAVFNILVMLHSASRVAYWATLPPLGEFPVKLALAASVMELSYGVLGLVVTAIALVGITCGSGRPYVSTVTTRFVVVYSIVCGWFAFVVLGLAQPIYTMTIVPEHQTGQVFGLLGTIGFCAALLGAQVFFSIQMDTILRTDGTVYTNVYFQRRLVYYSFLLLLTGLACTGAGAYVAQTSGTAGRIVLGTGQPELPEPEPNATEAFKLAAFDFELAKLDFAKAEVQLSLAESEPEAEGESEPEAEGETEPEAEGETEPEAEGETEPEPKSEAQVVADWIAAQEAWKKAQQDWEDAQNALAEAEAEAEVPELAPGANAEAEAEYNASLANLPEAEDALAEAEAEYNETKAEFADAEAEYNNVVLWLNPTSVAAEGETPIGENVGPEASPEGTTAWYNFPPFLVEIPILNILVGVLMMIVGLVGMVRGFMGRHGGVLFIIACTVNWLSCFTILSLVAPGLQGLVVNSLIVGILTIPVCLMPLYLDVMASKERFVGPYLPLRSGSTKLNRVWSSDEEPNLHVVSS